MESDKENIFISARDSSTKDSNLKPYIFNYYNDECLITQNNKLMECTSNILASTSPSVFGGASSAKSILKSNTLIGNQTYRL